MPRRRLGVALLFPDEVAKEIDGLRRALGDGALSRIPPHITLVPPVNVRQDDLSAVMAVLFGAAGSTSPFALELGPVTTFWPDTPTLKLDVGGVSLPELHRLRNAVFVPPLKRVLTWPFVPHATVADNADPDRIRAAVEALTDYQVSVPIERLHLLEESDGRTWSAIADVAFGRPSVVGRGGLPMEIRVSAIAEPAAVDRLLHGSAPASDFVVTAYRELTPISVVTSRFDGSVAVIETFEVAPDCRGQGVGSAVARAFVEYAQERGLLEVRLAPAILGCPDRSAFFSRMGFVDAIRRI